MFLGSRHIAVTIPEQVAGVLLPDGQFRCGGAVYNIEVECSTVTKAAEQVVRNVRKAREVGNRVLIALPDASAVPRLLAVLDGAFPGNRLWPDGIGLVWRAQEGVFHPHRVAGTEVWPFLDSAEHVIVLEPQSPVENQTEPLAETDPLPGLLRGIIQDFLNVGKIEATSAEIFAALPTSERARRTDEQVGTALSSLGLKNHRVRINGTRPRVYELSTSWTSDSAAPEMGRRGPISRSSNSPSGNN